MVLVLAMLAPVITFATTSSSSNVRDETIASSDSLLEDLVPDDLEEDRGKLEPDLGISHLQDNVGKTELLEQQTEAANQMETRASLQNISDAIEVSEWELYRVNNGNRESLTGDPSSNAVSNQAYNFTFNWHIPVGNIERYLAPGDYFILDIPQNENRETGHFYAVPSAWSTVFDDSSNAIYQYRIENKPDSDTQQIRVEFLEGISGAYTSSIDDSKLDFPGIMNYITKQGTQAVTFGGISKLVTFNAVTLNRGNGFSFKYGSAGTNNSLKWGIQFNGAANIELGGDEVNYNINGGEGSQYQGFYTDRPDRDVWHPWGSHYTDIFADELNLNGGKLGGYVEDELPVGADLTALTIAAYIPIPINLTQSNYADQKGAYLSSTAAFQSFVLADYGSGPTYRSSGDSGETQKPKPDTGFQLVTQLASETKDDFKKRVQLKPYQYGVYQDASGKSTVMMHFGLMCKSDNQQEKLSDLTDSPYTGRTITNPKTNQLVEITQFAAKAADYSIKRGHYAEEDREILENYYAITFGDTNIIGGKIAAYNISLTVRYPPDTPAGPLTNESAIYTRSALTATDALPKKDKGTYSFSNPYGSISLNRNQALLQKFDIERDAKDQYQPINGAKFKLQKKEGNTWQDVEKNSALLIFETAGLTYQDVENNADVEKTVDGLIKVDFSQLGLANGTYRFVETEPAPGYSEKESPNWNENENAVVSDAFAIPSSTTRGPTVTLWNKKLPQVSYTVNHFVQKSEGNTDKSNFELRETEIKTGYLGQQVLGEPSMVLLKSYEYDENLSISYGKITGIVTEDGNLTLELYYTIAAEVPFTLYKQGMNGKIMPSVDSNGNQLYDEKKRPLRVAFDIYEWTEDWNQSNPYNVGNGPKARPDVWKKKNKEPVITDALGRIRVPEIKDLGKYYAVVEVETYPEYVLPYNNPPQNLSTYREVYWCVNLSKQLIFSAPSWAHGTEVDKPEFELPSENNDYRYILKNRKPAISLFKVNEQDEPMASSDQQKVQFEIYRWNGGGYFYENYPYSMGQWTKIESKAITDDQGYFATIGQTGLEGAENKNYDWYLVREVSTYSGYQKAEGYWLVKTAWNKTTQQFEIFDVKYKIIQGDSAVDGDDPGHKVDSNKTALYLTNKAKPISFIKEDEKQNPLGGVHFTLYKPKKGELGDTGSEDPAASDTKWDFQNPIEKVSSDDMVTKGQVSFEDLTHGDYLLLETKTLENYQLPLGHWIVTINFYGEIETIKGRGDPLPPAFRVGDGQYYLPNYQKYSLPKAGGYTRLAFIVLGIILLGSAIILVQNQRYKLFFEKGKEDGKENK